MSRIDASSVGGASATPMTLRDDIRKAREETSITMRYTNYRGETAMRTIRPIALRHGTTPWHPQPGYLLTAFCTDKHERRDFALKDCDFTASPQMADAYEELCEMAGELAELLQMAVEQPLDADEKRDAVKEIARLKEHVGEN